MKDFAGVFLILLFAMGTLALIVYLGYSFHFYELVLIGIVISTIGIILFIKFFPGKHTRNKDDR